VGFLFICLLAVLGVELRAHTYQVGALPLELWLQTILLFRYFLNSVLVYVWAGLDINPSIYTYHVARMTDKHQAKLG
jgi:hypothetical protein